MEEPTSSSIISESAVESTSRCTSEEPPLKKIKSEAGSTTQPREGKDRLESRLISVLSCVVCFDLPNGAIYQVRLIAYLFILCLYSLLTV